MASTSSFFRNFCIGLVDGLTIPLALAAGLSQKVSTVNPVIIACLAAAFAGAITMSIGGYFEGKKYSPGDNPAVAAGTIGAGYLFGGLFVVAPFFFALPVKEAFEHTAVHTLIILLVAGYFESKLNGGSGWVNAIRVCIIGALVAAAAYFIARSF